MQRVTDHFYTTLIIQEIALACSNKLLIRWSSTSLTPLLSFDSYQSNNVQLVLLYLSHLYVYSSSVMEGHWHPWFILMNQHIQQIKRETLFGQDPGDFAFAVIWEAGLSQRHHLRFFKFHSINHQLSSSPIYTGPPNPKFTIILRSNCTFI